MKKRWLSCILALALVFTMVPSAFAASGGAPYSSSILNHISGASYVRCMDLDSVVTGDIARTQRTLEVYDALGLYLSSQTNWSEMVRPFREAFKSAGYSEASNLDSNGQEEYWFGSGQ